MKALIVSALVLSSSAFAADFTSHADTTVGVSQDITESIQATKIECYINGQSDMRCGVPYTLEQHETLGRAQSVVVNLKNDKVDAFRSLSRMTVGWGVEWTLSADNLRYAIMKAHPAMNGRDLEKKLSDMRQISVSNPKEDSFKLGLQKSVLPEAFSTMEDMFKKAMEEKAITLKAYYRFSFSAAETKAMVEDFCRAQGAESVSCQKLESIKN